MRAALATVSADRISRCAVLVAGGLCGVLIFFVALPLAMSSPYPQVQERAWVIPNTPRFASLMPIPVVIDDEDDLALEAMTDPEEPNAALADEALLDAPPSDEPITDTPRKAVAVMDAVDQYLWDVYERTPVKRDSTGDFTWKDVAAAKRMGVSLRAYVIDGMDPDFREQLYHAGRAMDAAGIHWAILSAFRDDYRQSLASGFKAHGGHSQHGGSVATGGYGHGHAVDVVSADGEAESVWQWLDQHGGKYGLRRPMPGIDPAHTQPQGSWHNVAVALRTERTRMLAQARPDDIETTGSIKQIANATR